MAQQSQGRDAPESLGDLPDMALVIRVQTGDQQAFEELFRRYNARVCSYICHLIDNHEVGLDLAQDTFLQAWEGLRKNSQTIHFHSWLYRIALNKVRDHWRRQHLIHWVPWGEKYEYYIPESMHTASPEEHVGEAEFVRIALAQVKEKYRACLYLRVIENLPTEQIAKIVGIRESSVSVYVKRAHEQFDHAYRCLEQEVYNPLEGESSDDEPDISHP